jgi:hypothetical protein
MPRDLDINNVFNLVTKQGIQVHNFVSIIESICCIFPLQKNIIFAFEISD